MSQAGPRRGAHAICQRNQMPGESTAGQRSSITKDDEHGPRPPKSRTREPPPAPSANTTGPARPIRVPGNPTSACPRSSNQPQAVEARKEPHPPAKRRPRRPARASSPKPRCCQCAPHPQTPSAPRHCGDNNRANSSWRHGHPGSSPQQRHPPRGSPSPRRATIR